MFTYLHNKVIEFLDVLKAPYKHCIPRENIVKTDEEGRENPDGSVTYSLDVTEEELKHIKNVALVRTDITAEDLLFQSRYDNDIKLQDALIGAFVVKALEETLNEIESKEIKNTKINKKRAGRNKSASKSTKKSTTTRKKAV